MTSVAAGAVAVVCLLAVSGAATGQDAPAQASGFDIHRAGASPANCDAGFSNPFFAKADCGFGRVSLPGVDPAADVSAEFSAPDGSSLGSSPASYSASNDDWTFDIAPGGGWPSAPITIEMVVDGTLATGTGTVFVNQLGAELAAAPQPGGYRPGDPIDVTGTIFELRGGPTGDTRKDGVGADLSLRTVDAGGTVRGPFPATAADDGTVTATLPPQATQGITPGADTDYRESVAIELVGTSYDDPGTGDGTPDPTTAGEWAAPDGTPAGDLTVSVAPARPLLENSFVSSVGWVKPGDTYPYTLRLENFRQQAVNGAVVTVTAPAATTLADPDGPGSNTTVSGDTLTWNAGTIPAASADGPGVRKLVAEATADDLGQDPRVVWKDLSTDAELTYTGGPPGGVDERSHGPKVIPPRGGYDTSRYGDRPFPVVPVDFNDRSHAQESSADNLASTINDPQNEGSTFNLYQEISYGQLYPDGTVPSDGIASAGWGYDPGFAFTQNTPNPDTCHGLTNANLGDAYQQLQPERIDDGWYQLPGSTDYYGDDSNGSALIGSETAIGALQDIDSACGPTAKSVYDAAQIADPEIDYSDYDTDKDGVVDFFMMIFAGLGGNGDSQLNGTPPYDNIWPHSSDLRGSYADPDTGLTGYISDDQLRDNEDRPLWYTDESRTETTTEDTGDELEVLVRVGPYNVNPETAIDKASVISHEYGHSLGLPDYYSTGSRETYGSWTLMATDYSQNIDIVGKKELGWVVPRVLDEDTRASGWQDTKKNIHEIDWKTPSGSDYTLSGPDVDNGEAYVATLPGRQIIDPASLPSGSHVWWSQSGNDFGCTPEEGHNLDIDLSALRDVPAGTPVTLSFKSRWDIEWDYDYGFVLSTTDRGQTYKSYPSDNGYTTPATQNPNQGSCQAQYGNGITGSSGSYQAGTEDVDRVLGNYPDAPFVEDSYDLSELAGQAAALRLSYATDPGLARPGWFIDDLEVTAGDQVIYESDFESSTDPAIYNGGCSDNGLQTAQQCTDGWQYVNASDGDPAEHAYLLEMRDRSGFDAHGRDESDRGDVTFQPGALLAYTDENHGYGNFGTDDPPAQSPLDSQPDPGSDTPDLDDAAFTAAADDSSFSDGGDGHVDNYSDPARADGLWRFDFNCLSFDVTSMRGTDIGPETFPNPSYNLVGDVDFTVGSGCGQFDYGSAVPPSDVAPTADAQARPTTANVGETVAFDGSGSFDDTDPPEALDYSWDFDGDGSADDTGRQTTHAYDAAGQYAATLTVTDSDQLSDTDTVEITVGGGGSGGGGGGGGSGGGGGGGSGGGTRCKGLDATILGTSGDDSLKGTEHRDVIVGRGGEDEIRGRGGRDVICGKGGDDKRLSGGGGRDRVYGGGGDDRAGGGRGRDKVEGGSGRDHLGGGAGRDKVEGGPGRDRCTGGEGQDRMRSCER